MSSGPNRRTTTETIDSTGSDVKSSESSGDELSASDTEKAGFSRIFIDAARFGEVLAEHASPTLTPRDLDGRESIKGFADLVGRDLDPLKQAESERLAKLTVNNWNPTESTFEGLISLEPDSYDDGNEDEVDSDMSAEFGETTRKMMAWAERAGQPLEDKTVPLVAEEIPDPEPVRISPGDNEREGKLSPEEVVKLLVNEFGPIAGPGEEERLLVAADGAFFQDIAILGMIHLTTHRVSFHASLLSTRPDLLPEQQVLRRGPVIIHRPGLRRKLKLWLELSHDMICSFASSKDEDRIRPLRSVLLSSIKKILPEDPEHPKILYLKIENATGITDAFTEFDTEESTRDWRRELQGALFLSRHRRANALRRQPDDESNGVRISVPLSHIKTFSTRCFLDTFSILTIELSSSDQRDLEGDEKTEENEHRPHSSLLSEDDKDPLTLELVWIQDNEAWKRFGRLVDDAKSRQRHGREFGSSRTFLDFGSLSFVEHQLDPAKVEDEKKEAIKHALSLGEEPDIWYTRARISRRSVCSMGYFAVTSRFVGFWYKSFANRLDEKYRLPVSMIVRAKEYHRKVTRTFAMTLELEGQADLTFEFNSQELREEVIQRVSAVIDVERSRISSCSTPTSGSFPSLREEPLSPRSFADAIASTATDVLSPLARTIDRVRTRTFSPDTLGLLPKVINLPSGTLQRLPPKHFVCLTIGSRGDVQPYIALGLGLQKEGHTVTIVTHEEYKEWVEGWGVKHRTAGGDPGALMKLSVEHRMFSPQFFKESLGNFRKWLDDLLVDAWEQCKDADVLLESPSAMAGVHIAEALGIPYFRTFTMPWTKTTEFPHSFLSPPVESASFNASSYILFDNVFWTATSGQINRWRRNTLHIGNTDMGHLAQSKIPFIYNFSSAVVPKPMDWGDAIIVSGYWFLDNPDLGWSPPDSLLEWMAKARADEKPIVYIGFGSITVPNPPALTHSIVKAVLKSDVRAIISKGWSARMSTSDTPEAKLPPECYSIDKIPHDWLFPQIDAAVHHGGAGTTGASLRAGIPTIIKPWFGDQFFWASRVQRLGAGLKLSSIRSAGLANALTKATSDRIMKERAAAVGQRIRMEDGVGNAIQAIYTYLPRAGRDRTELH